MNWNTRYAECKERAIMGKYDGYSVPELANIADKLLKESERLGKEVDKLINQRHFILNDLDQIIEAVKSRKKV